MKRTRKVGIGIFCIIWNFLCDIMEMLIGIFRVALSSRKKKYPLKIRAISSFIATVLTSAILVKLINGSFIWTAIQYEFASIQKYVAIIYSKEFGWNHLLSGDRYNFFSKFKENLISSNSFAKTLSDLSSNGGIFGKIIQIALIIACAAVISYLVYVIIKSLKNFFWSLNRIHRVKRRKKHHAAMRARARRSRNNKVIDINDYKNRKNA